MELSTVSTFFDRTPIQDVVSGAVLFLGQIKPYDESHRDSATAFRRVLSIAPGLKASVPDKVKVFGEVWLVGGQQTDGLDTQLRAKFIIHRALGAADLYSPAGMLTGTKLSSTYADMQWVADRKELEASSSVPQDFAAYLPRGTSVPLDTFVVAGGLCIYVESALTLPSGLVEARGRLQKITTPVACVISSRTYSQVSGSFGAVTTVTVNCFPMRWQDNYTYVAQTDQKYQEGDAVVILPAGTTVDSSAKLLIQGNNWAVMQVRTVNGVIEAHVRRA